MINALAKTMLLINSVLTIAMAAWVPFDDLTMDVYGTCSDQDYQFFVRNYVTKFSCTKTGGSVANVDGVSQMDGSNYYIKGNSGWCRAYLSSVPNYVCREIRNRLDRRSLEAETDEVLTMLNNRKANSLGVRGPAWETRVSKEGKRVVWVDSDVRLRIIDNSPSLISGDNAIQFTRISQVLGLSFDETTGLYNRTSVSLKYDMKESTIAFPEDLGHLEDYADNNRVDNFAKVFGSILKGWKGDSHTDVDNRKVESAGDNGFLAIANGDRAKNANVDCVKANWLENLHAGVGVPGGAVCIRVESQKQERGWTFAYGANIDGVKDIGCNSYDAKIIHVKTC